MASFVRDDNNKQKWMCRWEETDDTGVHSKKKRGFLTKKEAQQWYINYCAEKRKPTEEKKDLMFDEIYIAYMDYASKRIKESTMKNIKMIFEKKILPAFSGKAMSDLTPLTLLEWQNGLSGEHSYLKLARERFNTMLDFAYKYYDVPNALKRVDFPRNIEAKKEMHIWTPDQFKAFYGVIEDPQDKLIFLLLYTLGCRRGELQALMWQDIDLDKGDVHICHTYSETGKTKITSPKTAGSVRHISIPLELTDHLRNHKTAAEHSGPTDFVIGGKEVLSSHYYSRRLYAYAEAAGVPQIRVHDLRHSCASFLLSQGIDVVTVSKRLGHSNVAQTLNTYAHVMPSSEQRSNTLIDGLIKGL